MAEKWIVTGGCGFLGSNLAASLLESGIDVVVLDTLVRLGSDQNLAWLQERARRPGAGQLVHVRADTRSRTDVDDAFERHADPAEALALYERVRREATTRIVLSNRQMGPEIVMQLAEDRAPDGFGNIEAVIPRHALEDGYKKIAGFSRDALNAGVSVLEGA